MDRKFDEISMNHSPSKYDEWSQEKDNNKDDYKEERDQLTHENGIYNSNSGSTCNQEN